MNRNIKFSIIIPSYNVERFIEKAIQSIFNQSYTNYEIIIVDDGSSDATVDVINRCKNDKVNLIETKHQGVSAARNIGIRLAKGDYIIFLDSDDYIENWLLETIAKKLLRKSNIEAFVGMFNTVKEDENLHGCYTEILNKRCINNRQKSQVLEYFYRVRLIFTVWRFIVKREIVQKGNLYFKEGLLHEDEDWVARMLMQVDNFCLIEKPFYNYRIHKNSIMQCDDREHLRLRYDSRYQIAMGFLDMADECVEQYEKDFLYRCAYKNIQQIYRELKKKSHPLLPIRRRRH